MEFPFNINNLLGNEVSVIDSHLIPHRNTPNVSEYRTQLSSIIDQMGIASAKAQGLHGPITGASRLAYANHLLYILKDAEANNGLGAVVGILKTGRKKLFVYDHNGGQHEMNPLCVLDFYVHESRQRMGCGKKMFEYMLTHERVKPAHLAIDRPSHKFQGFLQKHYHLKATIPQVNNFVVFEGFFRDRQDGKNKKRDGKPPVHPYTSHVGERTHYSSHSSLGASSQSSDSDRSKQEREKEALSIVSVQRSRDNQTPGGRPGSGRSISQTGNIENSAGMVAQQSNYSRHSKPGSAGTSRSPNPAAAPPGKEKQPQLIGDPQDGRGASPPMLRRDGPSDDFLKINTDYKNPRAYQDRRGRLKMSTSDNITTAPKASPSASPAHRNRNPIVDSPVSSDQFSQGSAHKKTDSAWNIFGVPTQHQSTVSSANLRKYQQTRLW